MKSIRLSGMDMRVLVGKKVKAGDRTIWPVMRVSIFKTCEDRILAIQIVPLAMLIIEPAEQYALSFEGKPMTIDAILELAAPLRDALEKARKTRRITVD